MIWVNARNGLVLPTFAKRLAVNATKLFLLLNVMNAYHLVIVMEEFAKEKTSSVNVNKQLLFDTRIHKIENS